MSLTQFTEMRSQKKLWSILPLIFHDTSQPQIFFLGLWGKISNFFFPVRSNKPIWLSSLHSSSLHLRVPRKSCWKLFWICHPSWPLHRETQAANISGRNVESKSIHGVEADQLPGGKKTGQRARAMCSNPPTAIKYVGNLHQGLSSLLATGLSFIKWRDHSRLPLKTSPVVGHFAFPPASHHLITCLAMS